MTQNEKLEQIVAQQAKQLEAKNYLDKTDYEVIKAYERGAEVDEALKVEREAQRKSYNDAEAEIARIEAIAVEEPINLINDDSQES